MATLHLADMGADVIKIEDTEAGDYSRSMGRVRGVPPMSDFFRLLNRNKRAIRLERKNPKGCGVFLRRSKAGGFDGGGFRPRAVGEVAVGRTAVAPLEPHLVGCPVTS